MYGMYMYFDPSQGCEHSRVVQVLRCTVQRVETITLFCMPLDMETLCPKGPYTAHLRTPVPKAIPGMVFGTRVKCAVYGRFGMYLTHRHLGPFVPKTPCCKERSWLAAEALVFSS